MPLSRRDLLLAAGVSAAALTAAGGAAADAAPAAILPPADYPLRLSDIVIRDPFVLTHKGSGHYYLYARNVAAASGVDAVGTMVYRSQDLKRWSSPEVVFQVADGTYATDGAWAPEVHRWKGRWYLLVTLYDKTKPIAMPKAQGFGFPVQLPQFVRGTAIAVADSPMGPFTVLDTDRPIAPPDFMSLDGTLVTDGKGKPWMVYAHEWVQKIDGTIEAIPLKDDLSGASGDPIHLFKGSDATWISAEIPSPSTYQLAPYVTDGPQLTRLPGGGLSMLWSTYAKNINNPNGTVSGHYVQTQAISPSGDLKGPWTQLDPLVRRDSGHGMVFQTLGKTRDPRPMLITFRPDAQDDVARAKVYEVKVTKDGIVLGRQRKDIDGGG